MISNLPSLLMGTHFHRQIVF